MVAAMIAFEGLRCVGKSSTIASLAEVAAAATVPEVMPPRAIEDQPRCPSAADSEHWARNDLAKAAMATSLLARDRIVLVDRYYVSTLAYRHAALDRACSPEALDHALAQPFLPGLRPHLWVYLDEEPAASWSRARALGLTSTSTLWNDLAGVERMRRAQRGLLQRLRARGETVLWEHSASTRSPGFVDRLHRRIVALCVDVDVDVHVDGTDTAGPMLAGDPGGPIVE